MCTSVPHIDVFKTRRSTSSPCTSGTGTSSSHNPGSALAFTTAFIIFCTAEKLSTDCSDSHRFLRKNFEISLYWNAMSHESVAGRSIFQSFLLDLGICILAKRFPTEISKRLDMRWQDAFAGRVPG